MRREFLQLAKKFEEGKHNPGGMYLSEKLDGCRVFWDGGVSRGQPTESVPWASLTNPKTGERKTKIKPIASGLWSRYGNPIIAPDWFLNQLPQMFLDGELYAGRGNFQTLRSIIAKDVPEDDRWRQVQFAVFGAPCASQVFNAGEIKNPNFHKTIAPSLVAGYFGQRGQAGVTVEFNHVPNQTFEDELFLLQASLPGESDVVYLHQHTLLPGDQSRAEAIVSERMKMVVGEGGEGLMLRNPNSIWTPKRVSDLLKIKPFTDDQGTITGFVSGRKTNKGSKLLGLIGALILDYKGHRLELSGLTDEERKFDRDFGTLKATLHPGEDMPDNIEGLYFKRGDTVEFRYRELSDDGIPKEARYYRGV
jgi:DNA ligase-1